ncbi:hypothetical protein VST7929_03277 [Vibrio stylophorae]|uniref:DUF676 domain-containing protein n=1 Tax=Vibrio stylophorae TaxID=659351 RepID=A0ABM8ZY75_9VIBR|nr:alpha/beta fold hydrolase [Vibrio stylophorae]CAH0535803.1 hypothetical protein VST7929_03277 [Vibrio stylophorae]
MRYSLFFFIVLTFGCSYQSPQTRVHWFAQSTLLSGVSRCQSPQTAPPETTLDAHAPLVLLVHGCNGSAGRFSALAQVFEFHQQQTLCFSYDDRDSLYDSAQQLAQVIEQLSQHHPQITIIGHSMGGLISRQALTQIDSSDSKTALTLVTISTPFSGIHAAAHCASTPLMVASLGLTIPICYMASGDKWYEITAKSDFILQPQPLWQAIRHIQIITDERDSCREYSSQGQCITSDDIFSLQEQYFPPMLSALNGELYQIKAGHVEIVGYQGQTPDKLIHLFEQIGLMPPNQKTQNYTQRLAILYDIVATDQ